MSKGQKVNVLIIVIAATCGRSAITTSGLSRDRVPGWSMSYVVQTSPLISWRGLRAEKANKGREEGGKDPADSELEATFSATDTHGLGRIFQFKLDCRAMAVPCLVGMVDQQLRRPMRLASPAKLSTRFVLQERSCRVRNSFERLL